MFLKTEADPEGNRTVSTRMGDLCLLCLTFMPGHSSRDRSLYFITGGALFRFLGKKTARLEFRSLLGGAIAIVALHDFSPALPWYLYRFTQAIIHGRLMKAFQKHMARMAKTGAACVV